MLSSTTCSPSSTGVSASEFNTPNHADALEVRVSVDGSHAEFDGDRLVRLGGRLKAVTLDVGPDTPKQTIDAIVKALKCTQISSACIVMKDEASATGADLLSGLSGLPLQKLVLQGCWTTASVQALSRLLVHGKLEMLEVFGDSFASCSTVMEAIHQAGPACTLRSLTADLPRHIKRRAANTLDHAKYSDDVECVATLNTSLHTMRVGGIAPVGFLHALEENSSLEDVELLDDPETMFGQRAIIDIAQHTAYNRKMHLARFTGNLVEAA